MQSVGFITKQCEWCHADFQVGVRREQQDKRRFCSRKCSVRSEWAARRGITSIEGYEVKPRKTHDRLGRPPKAEKITMTCLNCGKEWQQYPSDKDRSKYCSRACYGSAKTGIPLKLKESYEQETKECEWCLKPFVVGGADHPVRSTRFCGRSCGRLAFWAQHKAAGTDISRPDMKGVPKPRLIEITETKKCEWCSALFVVGGSGKPRTRQFCSRSCARKSLWDKRRSGDATVLPFSHSPAREMSTSERTWFAGLFDGEGCISWPHDSRIGSLSLANTNYSLLEKIIEVTGTGRIGQVARQDKPHHQPCWKWSCNGDNAYRVIEQVYPYLIVKRNAATALLERTGSIPSLRGKIKS